MYKKKTIELLAPAGDLERLKVAVLYGADAVYIGGERFSLRQNAKNFSKAEIADGIEFAHSRKVKVYAAVNIFARNSDFDGMEEYLLFLRDAGIDAFIVSDPGVFAVVKKIVPAMEIHISTQANTTNYHSSLFWHEQGAKRIVLARELSLEEIKEISEKTRKTGLELEAFAHGAMCVSYSGRCLISDYMSGRSANKGDCAHPCRYKYYLSEETRPGEYMPIEEDDTGTYFFSSKDLCMITYIPEMIRAGITSLKIEGRMKSVYYTATTVKAYRKAIDDCSAGDGSYEKNPESYMEEIKKASNRDYTTGFYFGKPASLMQNYEEINYVRDYSFAAIVRGYNASEGIAEIEQRSRFFSGDTLEVLKVKGENISITVNDIFDENGERVQSAKHAAQKLFIKTDLPLSEFDILRKVKQA